MPLPPALIAKLKDGSRPIAEVADTIREATGALPMLVIDITDPPTQPRTRAGEVEASDSTPDGSLRKLAREIALRAERGS